jgi:hypothetical protein
MENEGLEKENKLPKNEINYTKNDLIQTENPRIYSMIGKTIESNKPTAPIYSFGKAERKDLEKVFCTKALSKTQFLCKAGPGPVYSPTIDLVKKADPSWSFGDQPRVPSAKEPYEHYKIMDICSDPITAEIKTKKTLPVVKFKSGQRVN